MAGGPATAGASQVVAPPDVTSIRRGRLLN
jgi:hypothetical protein